METREDGEETVREERGLWGLKFPQLRLVQHGPVLPHPTAHSTSLYTTSIGELCHVSCFGPSQIPYSARGSLTLSTHTRQLSKKRANSHINS